MFFIDIFFFVTMQNTGLPFGDLDLDICYSRSLSQVILRRFCSALIVH